MNDANELASNRMAYKTEAKRALIQSCQRLAVAIVSTYVFMF